MGLDQLQVLPAPALLRRDVECLLLYGFHGNQRVTTNVFPKGVPGIVFHDRNGNPAIESIQVQSGRTASPQTLFVYGPIVESSVMNFGEGSYTVIQVVLKPHALRALFGINALTLKDTSAELNEFSSLDINEQLLNVQGAQSQAELLIDFLVSKLKQTNRRDDLVEESLRLIHNQVGTLTVRTLLEQFEISERQCERRFSQTVGVSPYAYIRVKRFNEAIRLMKTRQCTTLTEIAYALNFHDQSHFIRDIKAFTGITPGSLSQRADDFFHNQAGYSYV
jgi:AraC-like DNA-binding protein